MKIAQEEWLANHTDLSGFKFDLTPYVDEDADAGYRNLKILDSTWLEDQIDIRDSMTIDASNVIVGYETVNKTVDGKPVYVLDENGDPVVVLDENGAPKYLKYNLDSDEIDPENGDPRLR